MIVDRARIAAALPDYEFGEPIGQGPHGVVLRALDRGSGVARAVKVLPSTAAEPVVFDHPHVVRVIEHSLHGELRLVVSELLPGGALTDRGHSAPETVCAWGLAVASALAAAHDAGVVHGGLRPTNLLLDADGTLKVSDFGGSVTREPMTESRYLAPEQVAVAVGGGAPGPEADVYALGVVLHDLLATAGRPVPAIAGLLLRMLDDAPGERPSAGECAVALAGAATRDLGTDWPWKSGVPLRTAPAPPVPTGVFPDVVVAAPVERRWRPTPAPARRASPEPIAPPSRWRWVLAVAAVAAMLAGGAVVTGVVTTGPSASLPEAAVALPVDEGTVAEQIAVYSGAPGLPHSLAFAPSTDRIAFVDGAGSLYVWTPSTVSTPGRRDAVGPIRIDGTISDVRFEDVESAVLTTGTDGAVHPWTADTGAERGGPITGLTGPAVALAQTGSSGAVAVADAAGIRISRSGAFAPTATIPRVPVVARGLTFSPDGRILASVGPDGVRLWDATTGALRTRLAGATGDTGVVFSPDGARVAAAAGRNDVRIFHVATGDPVGPPITVGDLRGRSALAFTPRGDELVTCVGTTVTRWDATTGRRLRPPERLLTGGAPGEPSFNRDATRVALPAGDGRVRLFSVAP